MPVTTTDDYIMFYFDQEILLNILIVRTGRRANSIKRTDDKNLHEYSMTDNERAEYNLMRPVIAAEVYKEGFANLGQGIDDAFQENVNIDDVDNKVIAYTFNPPDSWDPNMEGVTLRYTEEALVAGMLKEWYHMVGLTDLALEWEQKYNDWRTKVRSSLLQSTEPIKTPYNVGF